MKKCVGFLRLSALAIIIGMLIGAGTSFITKVYPPAPLEVHTTYSPVEKTYGEVDSQAVLFDSTDCFTFKHGPYVHNYCYEFYEEAKDAANILNKQIKERNAFDSKVWKAMN